MIRCIPIPLINRIAQIHHHNLSAYRAKTDKFGIDIGMVASSEGISGRAIRAVIRQMPPGPADSPAPPWRLK